MNRLKFYNPSVSLLRLLCALLSIFIFSFASLAQVAENEPNNDFATADAINTGTIKTGNTTNSPNDPDYFSTVLPSDGAVKIYVQGTNTGGANGYLYLYGYDSRQGNGQILAKYVSNNSNVTPGQTIYDTITLFGRAAEAFYLRLEAAGSFSYTVRYEMANTSVNDPEPNDIFAQSIAISRKQEKQGHTGYTKGGVADQDDFYKTTLPLDGTLKIYVKGTNRNGGNGYMYLYGYDGRQGNGQVLAKYIANNSNVANNETVYDTILLYGRSADDFYFRLQSAGAFDYTFSYDLADSSANDIEPNNTFETSLPITRLQQLKGHTGYVNNGVADPDDFYKTTLAVDGALKIFIEGTNQNGGPGYMYLYGYDGRKANGQVLAKYIANNYNVGAGQTIRDTITLYGRAADAFYFRLQSAGGFNYSIKYDLVEGDVNDVEPNNTFEESVPLNQLDEKKGHISYLKNGAPDGDDFYKTVIPIDGTLKVYVKGTNKSGSNAYLYMYGYDRRKGNGQIFATYIGGTSNVAKDSSVSDSITIYGVLADTFYFRIQSAGAFDYSVKYNTTPNSQFDEEPNNNFGEAGIFKQGVTRNGQVGYQLGGVRDNDDFYKTLLPADGTMKIYVQGTNNSGSNGYLYLYGYDKRQGSGQVLAKYIGNNANLAPSASVFDTIYLYGRAADTFYLRFESVGAFSYSFSYDIVDTSTNDVEPNNTFAQALPIERLERKRGHIGYVKSGAGDADDFYAAPLSEDGTLKIVVKGTNRSGANGYLYLYAYDGRLGSGQILAKYIGNNSNLPAGADVYDTIYLQGRAADTVYFRIISVGAFNYSIDFDLIQTSENDIEPNNSFEQTLLINPEEIKKGHVGYLKNGVSDANDYYKTLIPSNGNLKIYVKGINRSGANGYLYIYGYDKRKGGGQVLAKYVGNNSNLQADSTIVDSIILYGRATDSFYFRITSVGAFSYSLNYVLTDTSVLDVEPNNSFEQTLAIDAGEERKGNIGYVKNGVPDADDYYKTKLPADGTLKIYLQGKNKSGSNGYMYLYGYDSRKGSGQVLAKYVANGANIVNDSTIYDTIYLSCRAADSFYLRLTSAGSFSYSLKYEMLTGSADDAGTNDNFETATLVPVSTTSNGHIGYLKGGTGDGNDYYKTPLTGNGSVQIIIEATNTSGGAGNVYLYGYDNRKGSGQILARYVSNNGNVPAGTVIRDTITLNCYYDDTLFTRFTSAGCFTYSFKVEFINKKPKAAFDYTRVGDLFAFSINSKSNAENFSWDFGNGTTSTLHEPPLMTFKPGFYEAKLIATNTSSGCNYTDVVTKGFTIKGVERYTPTKGGQGMVDFGIYGGGLTMSTQVKISKGGTTLTPANVQVSPNGNIYIGKFDLHAATPGIYDVDIITADSTYHYANGFVVEAGRTDNLRVEIIGRNAVRENADYLYTVRLHNDGNSNTGISEVYMLTSDWYEIKNLDSVIFPLQITDVNPDTLRDVYPVTKKMGFPMDGQFRGYYVNDIPPGGFKDIRITIKFLPHATVGNIYVWAQGPYSGSPLFDWVDGCWKARLRRAFTYGNIGLNKIPVVDCGWNVLKTLAVPLTAAYTGISSGWDLAAFFGSAGKTAFGMIKHCAGEAAAATGVGAVAAPEIEIAADVSDIPFDTYDIIQMEQYATENCPDKKDKDTKRPVNRTSLDPNEKTGPLGYGVNHYISGTNKLMGYGVFFENKASATAPAQTVVVLDTLDQNVYDLHTFKIGTFGIGKNTYGASIESQEFVTDVNLNANIAVRANMKLDTLTGIIKATFKTIDRQTHDETTDPLAGFLPANVNSPEGQGFFTYSIEMKNGLPTGTQIQNKATILFDNNAPIVTNEWSNIIDNDLPSSSINSITKVNDTTALIIPQGNDVSSGVEQYRLYVSIDGAPYTATSTLTDSVKVSGRLGKSYSFYLLAIDSVGNVESKTAVSEGSITFQGGLPVTMLPLNGTKEGAINHLHWITASENKNKGFSIERSINGRDFTPINFVSTKAAGGFSNTQLQYDYPDAAAPKTAFYRLVQTDLDGRITYSNVVKIDRNKLMTISVYPNPAHGNIRVVSDVNITSIQLTDMSGRAVKWFTPAANSNYSLQGIKSGVYILQVAGKDGQEQVKIIVQ